MMTWENNNSKKNATREIGGELGTNSVYVVNDQMWMDGFQGQKGSVECVNDICGR
jgi:hypothetical protein